MVHEEGGGESMVRGSGGGRGEYGACAHIT